MKFDITTFPDNLRTVGDLAKEIEGYGFDGFWTAEAAHNPFLPLAIAANTTGRINLGTQIAVAFPRSPMVTAQIAWDLAAQSGGRFILGLGTQVKAHIKLRFSTEWVAPVERLREYIEAMRAIWRCWQTNAPLRYKGEHYTLGLMTPFFNPGPIEQPNIPVYVAGVNAKICQMAGEMCQGLHAHAFHTRRYIQEVVLPNVEVGLKQANRTRADFQMTIPIFTVTGRNAEEIRQNTLKVKSHIAFYASTPTYKAVMDLHGWGEIAARLTQMVREGKWNELGDQISDAMLNEIAIVAPPDELPGKIKERYARIADRICFGWETNNADSRIVWQLVAKGLAGD